MTIDRKRIKLIKSAVEKVFKGYYLVHMSYENGVPVGAYARSKITVGDNAAEISGHTSLCHIRKTLRYDFADMETWLVPNEKIAIQTLNTYMDKQVLIIENSEDKTDAQKLAALRAINNQRYTYYKVPQETLDKYLPPVLTKMDKLKQRQERLAKQIAAEEAKQNGK